SHQDASVVHASEFAPSVLPSVIIRDLDPLRALLGPNETDPVLVVDPDAVLPLPVFAQRFYVVPRRDSQRRERDRCVQLVELALCDSPQLFGARASGRLGTALVEDILRSVI